MDPRLARMAALKQEKEAKQRAAQALEMEAAASQQGSSDSRSALHSTDELMSSSEANDVDGTELPQTAPAADDEDDDVDGEENVEGDADAEGDDDEDDDGVDGEEQTQQTQEGEQEGEVKPAVTEATSGPNGDTTQEQGPSTVSAAVTDGTQEVQTGGEEDDDADGEAMEESDGDGEEEAAQEQQQQQQQQTVQAQPQEQTVTEAIVEPTSEIIKAEAAVSPPQPQAVSKTAPLQPLSQKAEARDQVDAFLAQIQAQQSNGALQSSSAPQPDLSTPAARRAHLLARLDKEPRDSEAWLTLLADSESRLAEGDPTWTIDDVRSTYDKFLEVYPCAARQWLAYIDLELSLSNFQQVEALFTRCLRSTPSVSLWKSYLSYTRRVNPLPAPSGSGDEEGERGRVRRLIEEAYEFATRHVGMSRDAGEIWGEYIKFIKDREAKTPWQSGQKMDDLRKIYQRVVGIPLANVEAIWREYDQFENGLNRVTAKKFLAERSAAYMTARSALREMRHLVDHLHRPLLPRLPAWVTTATAPPPTSADLSRDRERLEAWKAYLQWEESDPLELGEGEGAAPGTNEVLRKRVEVAYAKATMHMRFNSEVWWMASRWAESCGRMEESVQWLKDGMKACPGSYLLSFAYTESCETRGVTSDCSAVFEALLSHTHSQIEALEAELEASLSSIDASAAAARSQVLAAKRDAGDADELEGEEREEERKLEEARDAQKEALRATMKPRIDSLKEEASLVWIRWMHFVRKTEGLRPTRAIFSKARRSPHVTWQIYEASALMEYHCSKDANVATKVFELALKTFGSDEAFVVRYLDFLISINDENNARSLFERTLPSFPPNRARPLWSRWASYEYTFGDSTSIRKLEARLAEMYPEESPLKRLRDRSAYGDLEVIGLRDLGEERLGEKGGATAAERAVLAANSEVAPASAISAAAAGDAAITAKAVAAAAAVSTTKREEGNNDLKRGREAGDDGANKRRGMGMGATPPAGPPAAGSRSSLPPQGAVFPAAGSGGPSNGFQPQQQQQQQFGTPPPLPSLADGILYFLSLLPNARSFDGPRLPAEQVMEAVRSSNIAAPAPGVLGAPGMAGGAGGPGMGPAGAPGGWAAGRGAGVVPPLGPSGRGGGVVGRGARRRF